MSGEPLRLDVETDEDLTPFGVSVIQRFAGKADMGQSGFALAQRADGDRSWVFLNFTLVVSAVVENEAEGRVRFTLSNGESEAVTVDPVRLLELLRPSLVRPAWLVRMDEEIARGREADEREKAEAAAEELLNGIAGDPAAVRSFGETQHE